MKDVEYINTVNITSNYFESLSAVAKNIDFNILNEIVNVLVKCIEDKNTIYTIGNGGSSANASHVVVDFIKLGQSINRKIKTFCLSDNIPSITAIANDISYEKIFSFQLSQLAIKNDVLLIFSCSGNSSNILHAVETAKVNGAIVISFTGFDGGKLSKIVDYNLHVPINDMQIVEDIHMSIVHIIYKILLQHGS
jgi:D-sedoheptulose 7-phosphate isomerase